MQGKKEKILRHTKKIRQQTLDVEREFKLLLRERNFSSEEMFEKLESWSELYSLSFNEFIAVLAVIGGMVPLIKKVAEQSEHLDAKISFFEQMKDFEFSTDVLEHHMTKHESEKILASFLIALMFNIKALAHRNRPINTMIEQIRDRVEGYEEIIFEAVSIDPSVVANPEIAEFLSLWAFERNEEMLLKLSKSIIGKYPRGKRTVGLDEFRLMTTVLEEVNGEVNAESVYQMNQLLNLIAEGKDLEAAIQKHLQMRKKDTRTSNAQTTS